METLKFYNGYGGFKDDGKSYFIKVNKKNRLPNVWSNILTNGSFGTVVTENMGGYTWNKNSRLNRITAWNNAPVQDIPSEIIYIKDLNNEKIWNIAPSPIIDDNDYYTEHSFGFSSYYHFCNGIEQKAIVFVPENDNIKVNILELENKDNYTKNIKIVYYIKPVIGEDEIKTNTQIDVFKEQNIVFAYNMYGTIEGFNDIAYISSSENISSFTGQKDFVLGKGGLTSPYGINAKELNNKSGLGKNSCIALEIKVNLEPNQIKKISLILGADENINNTKNTASKYQDIENCYKELENIKKYWKDKLEVIQVKTKDEKFNIMINGWCAYQTISSRLLGRTGYFQSGGAYGFRDQLQDTIGMKYIDVGFMKEQIIRASKHQFIEGDVEHWWHEETQRGIRTRFSDDLLWLPYLVCEYINFTGDNSILDIKTKYLEGAVLAEGEYERYDKYLESDVEESIYMHCIRAIEKSLNFGKNGLPKIGTGDWNDGFSSVGKDGIGESVWLGFFLYDILNKFIPICVAKGENEKAEIYEEIARDLKVNLNKNAWDGNWYRRAYTDDGKILGSNNNTECKIDSIAQSWSVISEAGEYDKKEEALNSLENLLVDRENGIIKLLTPPFYKSDLEPGYIKSYKPGVRENGGQYTHAAIWAVIAEALMKRNNKAFEFYSMINPISHSENKEFADKYKAEPYVIPADIYGAENLIGRGGWTWYTGSSSWFYEAGIRYILGLNVNNGNVTLKPCVPNDWDEFTILYKVNGETKELVWKRP